LFGDMCIGVGSSDLNDKKSSFSTYGFAMDMTAIGERVASPAPGGLMGTWTGTSMAAPMVSGGFALALAERAFQDSPKAGKTIASSGDNTDVNNLSYILQIGKGRLNLERFLTEVKLR
jgi:thermitase